MSNSASVILGFPNSYKEVVSAQCVSEWKLTISTEHDSLLKNKTWDVVTRQPDIHVLPCMYIFLETQSGPKVRSDVLGSRQLETKP